MTFNHCPECGRLLTLKPTNSNNIPYCEKCQKFCFPVSLPCVICLVVNEYDEIALIKQTYDTENKVCVAGFIEQGETAEQAAIREVREEIGLIPSSIRYISSYYYPKKDNLMLGFAVYVKKARFHLQEDEVESAQWYSIENAGIELSRGVTGKDLLKDWLAQR